MRPNTGQTQLSLWTYAESVIDVAKDGDDTSTSNLLTLSSGVSPAKTYLSQETALGWKAHALVYGGKCFGSYARLDLALSCWKMSPLSRTSAQMRDVATFDPQTHLWSLVRFPKSGMTASGKLYQLPMPERLISANGGSAWATPCAADTANRQVPSNPHITSSGQLKLSSGQRSQVRLSQQAKYYNRKKLLSTPTVSDSKNNANPSPVIRCTPGLNNQVATNLGDKLNPDWVEQLMGFPVGWTDID